MTENSKNQETEVVRLVPPITPELLEKNEDFQKQIRETLNATAVPARQMQRARQLIIVEETKAIMRGIKISLDKARANGEADKAAEFVRQLDSLAERLADALFESGEFAQASEATLKPRKKELFSSYVRALEVDDELHCEHRKYVAVAGQTLPNYFRERDIWSSKHHRFVSVVKCNECDFRNLKPLPDDLAEASRIRAEFIKANKQ